MESAVSETASALFFIIVKKSSMTKIGASFICVSR